MLSAYFKERIENYDKKNNQVTTVNLYKNLKDTKKLLESIRESDTIVMIGPCYVDTYPADTIFLLEQMAQTEGVLHGQKLYGFIQGGMPYVHTHETGLKLLDNFADENDVQWMGGYVMGGGAMLDGRSLEQAIGAKKIVPAVNMFIQHIAKGEESPDSLYIDVSTKVPYLLAVFLSHYLSHMLKKKFKEKGINYKAPSPYLK
jgi:multimeric flavodoxin WrbA